MKKTLSNILTVMLAMLMALYVFPYEVIAMTTDTSENIDASDVEIIEEAQDEEAYVLHEVDELRETEVKHYRLSNGSYAAVEFPNAVHYETEEEEYIDIDNTLTLGENGYNNTDNAVEYTFSDDFDSNTILDCTYGEYGISFNFVKEDEPLAMGEIKSFFNEALNLPDRQYIEISNPGTEPENTETNNGDVVLYSIDNTEDTADTESTDEEKLSVEEWIQKEVKSSSSIKYVNYSEGIDLRYDLIGDTLKEYIILKKVPDTNQFTFDMTFTELTPTLNEDKSITLANAEGEIIFTIPAPYMADDAGNVSYDCAYGLAETEDGYTLTITVSEEWLNAEDRVYPVMIDPALIQTKYGSDKNTDLITEYYSFGNNNHAVGTGFIYMGRDSGSAGTYVTYMKANVLPALPFNCMPTKGYFHLGHYEYSTNNSVMTELTMSARRADSSASWYTNYIDNTVLDYTVLSQSSTGKYVSWDITDAVKEWYNDKNTNTGIVFVPDGDMTTNCAKATLIGYNNASFAPNCQPKFVVFYRNTVGLDDISGYHTQSVGNAGTGNVRYSDGALTVVHTDAVYDSVAMPFSLSHIYNSTYALYNFTEVGSAINTLPFNQMHLGKGWKLSLQQTVKGILLEDLNNGNDTYKVYTDADGTEEYFKYNSETGEYVDESGKGRKLIVNSAESIVIKDKDDNWYEFHNGYLYRIQDPNGNYIRIHYSNASNVSLNGDMPSGAHNRIFKITQSNNNGGNSDVIKTVATLTYNSGGYLTKITDYAGKTTEFTYSNSAHISCIKETTGTYSYYNYVNTGTSPSYCMTRIYNGELKYGVDYTYTNKNKVTQITEYAVNSSGTEIQGARYQLTTVSGNMSYIKYCGNDRNFNTTDDLVTTYLFDDYGRTVNSYSSNKAIDDTSSDIFKMYGMSAATYTPTYTDTPNKNNRITSDTLTGGIAYNYLLNAGAENSTNHWTLTNAERSNQEKRTGAFSFKINGTASNANGASVKQDLVFNTSGRYTASVYVKLTSLQTATPDIIMRVNDQSYSNVVYSRKLTKVTPSGIWERLSVTFDAVKGTKYSVCLGMTGTTATLYADDFQVESGDGASRVDLLDNGGFETASYGWTKEQGLGGYTTEKTMANSTRAFYLTAKAGLQSQASTTVKINNSEAKSTYVLSAWAYADSIPLPGETVDDFKLDSKFKMYAKVTYQDGTARWYNVNFNPEIENEWQHLTVMLAPQRPVDRILVGFCYGNNNGTAYFDNISLIQEDVQTYTYDDDGNLKTTTSMATDDSVTYSYDDASNLTQAIFPGSGTYNVNYQQSGNTHLAESVETEDLLMSMYYTPAGTNTYSYLASKKDTGLKRIYSEANYTANGDHISSSIDGNGISSTYAYNSQNKLSSSSVGVSETYGSGQMTTVYTYNSAGRNATTYISGKVSLSYSYTNGQLSGITRGGYVTEGDSSTAQSQSYTFTYDEFGNTLSTNVGSNNLARYTYAPNNGHLTKMTYNNGINVEYQYDNLDRIVKVLYNGNVLYSYAYNSDGSLYMAQEHVRGYTYYYNYDGLGRLIGYSMYTNGVFTESVNYGYDEYNRANTTTVKGGDNSVTSTYTYNNNNGTLTKLNNAYTAAGLTRSHGFDYTYDGLMRLTEKKLTHHNASLTSTYGYADNLKNSTYTSSLVDEVNYKTHSSTGNIFEFDYSYDRVGNIKSVTSDGSSNYYASGTVNYFYDKMNQLVMEENLIEGKTYLYKYDTYGNIRSRTVIEGTGFSSVQDAENALGIFTHSSDTYTYGNAQWKDQLTAYNGAAFTYDAIGNPTKYNNGRSYTFQWQNGRELYRSSVGGKVTFYAYGENGLRTIKNTNGGEKYLYYYAGELLISQVWDNGAQSLNFLYDENGSPYGFIYDDGTDVTPYFYVKNVQGDVIAIMDETGVIWATYNYDAWGNVLSVTDGNGNAVSPNADHIANINPIRYRGYYYDNETGFYYLGSRYYDPSVCRFINADTFATTGQGFIGFNMYIYCLNNPIMLMDGNGTKGFLNKLLKAGAAFLNSFSGKLAFGEGFGFSYSANKGVVEAEVTVISKHDMISVRNNKGTETKGQEVENRISFSGGIKNTAITYTKSYGCTKYHSNNYDNENCNCDCEYTLASASPIMLEQCPEAFIEYDDSGTSIGFEFQAYCIIGGTASVEFDPEYFINECIRIFSE